MTSSEKKKKSLRHISSSEVALKLGQFCSHNVFLYDLQFIYGHVTFKNFNPNHNKYKIVGFRN